MHKYSNREGAETQPFKHPRPRPILIVSSLFHFTHSDTSAERPSVTSLGSAGFGPQTRVTRLQIPTLLSSTLAPGPGHFSWKVLRPRGCKSVSLTTKQSNFFPPPPLLLGLWAFPVPSPGRLSTPVSFSAEKLEVGVRTARAVCC